MRCPYCGHKNPNNAKRCEVCGRRLDKAKERRREKKILVIGLVLIAVILAAGVGAMFGISHVLEHVGMVTDQPQKVTIVTTPTPASADSVEADSEAGPEQAEEAVTAMSVSAASSSEESPTESPLEGTLVGDDRKAEIASMGYSKAVVSNATATSTIQQTGIDNTPHVLYDGQLWSSWQDGVDGDGIGESITFTFDRTYKIRYMVLRLGNWYSSDDYYYRNNRPSKMTFVLGGESFQMDFPDEKREFTVELSRDVPADSLRMVIDGVYSGTMYQDTCINEVDVYGSADGSASSTDTTSQNSAGQESGTAGQGSYTQDAAGQGGYTQSAADQSGSAQNTVDQGYYTQNTVDQGFSAQGTADQSAGNGDAAGGYSSGQDAVGPDAAGGDDGSGYAQEQDPAGQAGEDQGTAGE